MIARKTYVTNVCESVGRQPRYFLACLQYAHGHRLIGTSSLHLVVSCSVLTTLAALEGKRLGLHHKMTWASALYGMNLARSRELRTSVSPAP